MTTLELVLGYLVGIAVAAAVAAYLGADSEEAAGIGAFWPVTSVIAAIILIAWVGNIIGLKVRGK